MPLQFRPVSQEIDVFRAAAALRLPVMLKGPPGCGKTRLVQHMAKDLGRPLITVACQEELGSAELVGRHLLEGGDTIWRDGPLTRAVRQGAICYLDELVEARAEVLTLLHPLTDDRRLLPIDRLGQELSAHPDFLLVASANPGTTSALRELRDSTRQRFITIQMGWPGSELEAEIVAEESGCSSAVAQALVALAAQTRRLRSQGLRDGASTRLLVHAARLHQAGLPLPQAARVTLAAALSDDPDLILAIDDLIVSALG